MIDSKGNNLLDKRYALSDSSIVLTHVLMCNVFISKLKPKKS